MSLYCHITSVFRRQCEELDLLEKAKKLIKKIETDQRVTPQFSPSDGFTSMGRFDRFCFRVIESPNSPDDNVAVLYSAFRTTDQNWHRWRKERDFRNELFDRSFKDEFLVKEIDERLRGLLDPGFKPPSTAEELWLTPVWARSAGSDIWFLETEDWINTLKGPYWRGRLSEVCTVLSNFSSIGWKGRTFHWGEDRGVGISYRYYPEYDYVLLAGLSASNSCQDDTRYPEPLDRDAIRRHARRAYTEEIVADTDTWMMIVGDEEAKEANLALSVEELELLDAVKFPSHDKPRYPLFINGRAGSGKSTLLLYLLSDYVQMQLERLTQEPERNSCIPLYLTCSQKLRDRACSLTRKLLDLRGNRAGRIRTQHQTHYIDRLESQGFQVFHTFLKSCLPSRERQRFDDDQKYISYTGFKRLWSKRCKKDKRLEGQYHPDLIWHFLRSYVKGMRPDSQEWVDPEYYRTILDKKHRTVSVATYAQLYDEVWRSWYLPLCENEGYWDDQDLTIAFLEHGNLDGRQYPAIFCDEAQDFTKIEIQAILRLSLFMYRRLNAHQLRDVPLVFAGDPLQTLNPTGFRWASIKSQLYQSLAPLTFIGHQGSSVPNRPSLHTVDLNHNYRSAPPIVDFCNLILALRSVAVEAEDVKLQQCWWPRQERQYREVLAYELGQARRICEAEGTVILVDTHEGGETQYVEEDPLLKSIVVQDKETGIPKNVLSPMSAKGLEFNRVVLYRFGRSCPEPLSRLMTQKEEYDIEQHLSSQYYLNRLYVAASRAKRMLFVVDERAHIDGFWMFARNNDLLGQWEAYRNSEWDIKQFLARGDNIDRDSSSAHTESNSELASKFRILGEAQEDPSFLRRARMYYEQDGNERESSICLAKALSFEGEYIKSGREFEQVGEFKTAVSKFWRAQNGLTEIVSLCSKHPEVSSQIESKAALYEQSPSDGISIIEQAYALIGDFVNHIYTLKPLNTVDFVRILRDDRWREIIARAVMRILTDPRGDETVAALWEFAVKLRATGFPISIEQYAELAYKASKFDVAVKEWNRLAENKRPRQYFLALAETKPPLDRMEPFARAKEFSRVIDIYESISSKAICQDTHHVLAAFAYDIQGQTDRACKMLKFVGSADALRSSLREHATESISKEFRLQILFNLLEIYLRDSNFREFAAILRIPGSNAFPPAPTYYGLQQTDLDRRALELLASNRRLEFEIDVAPLLEGYIESLLTGQERPDPKDWASLRWKDKCQNLPVFAVGYALERILKLYVAALSFYEVVEKAKWVTSEENDFARRRLVKTRAKYAEHLNIQGRYDEANQQLDLMDLLREKYPEIPEPHEIPEFPELLTAQNSASVTESDRLVLIGDEEYILKYNDGGTVIIGHQEHVGKLRLDMLEGTARTLRDLRLKQIGSRRWHCDDWDLTIAMIEKNRIRLTDSDGNEETLDFPSELL